MESFSNATLMLDFGFKNPYNIYDQVFLSIRFRLGEHFGTHLISIRWTLQAMKHGGTLLKLAVSNTCRYPTCDFTNYIIF
jgi:hypothetical protein